MRRGIGRSVELAAALDRRGQLVAASSLDAGDRGSRGPFRCPGCGEQVVARLGRIRVGHFAHRPGSACSLTAPETALHLEAKARLLALCADAFTGARRVVLRVRCAKCRRTERRDLGGLGDEARAEGTVGGYRADVLVSRGGRPALAIEVLASHAVEPAKELDVAASGVALVEVDANGPWERTVPDGSVEVACLRSAGFRPCAACAAADRADADRALGGEAAEIAELESYRARGLLQATPDPEYFDPPPANSDPEYSGAADLLTAADRAGLSNRFHCPDCGSSGLSFGDRIARHPCPGQGQRPVAWRGYDGRVAELRWWKK